MKPKSLRGLPSVCDGKEGNRSEYAGTFDGKMPGVFRVTRENGRDGFDIENKHGETPERNFCRARADDWHRIYTHVYSDGYIGNKKESTVDFMSDGST